MTKERFALRICLFFLAAAVGSGLFAFASSQTAVIKNAEIFPPDGSWQPGSFIIIHGCKIKAIGSMKSFPKKEIFDAEYDLQGKYLYPAFIDALNKGFLLEASPDPEDDDDSVYAKNPKKPVDRSHRKPLDKRNYFFKRKAVEQLKIEPAAVKESIKNGFAIAHVVLPGGIARGTSTVISLAGDNPREAVLMPERFMALSFNHNSVNYPVTPTGIMAELRQLKADCFYYREMKALQFFDPGQRRFYQPELDILLPYFTGRERFLITITDYSTQRMAEILEKQLEINPALVGHADIWRRKVPADAGVILPLDFTPPRRSKYAVLGEKLKKEAGEKIYPQKLAGFLNNHTGVSLAPPGKSDYKKLFKNIRTLMKQGVTERVIIDALTANPAVLLGIEKYAGSLEPGKLANLAVFDKKIASPDAAVKIMFVEGKVFEFKKKKKKPNNGGSR
jgi:hypothetical protein